MIEISSTRYPGASLSQAIDNASKLFQENRTNPIDREAAAKDMGFSGITGTSTKALADLAHYGLIEKAGKGAIRVSQRSVDILHPASPAGKAAALRDAAFSPSLFASLRDHFHDGIPSENALRTYLTRKNFTAAGIGYVVTSYIETCRLVQQEAVIESDGQQEPQTAELGRGTAASDQASSVNVGSVSLGSPQKREVPIMSGERVIFVDEAGPGQYLKVIASGELDAALLEALEDFTKRRKKRFAQVFNPKEVQDDEAEQTSQ